MTRGRFVLYLSDMSEKDKNNNKSFKFDRKNKQHCEVPLNFWHGKGQCTLFDHSHFCDLMYQISTGRLTRTNEIP
jgi:hypothetical protein